MNTQDIISDFRQQLACRMAQRNDPPVIKPLGVDIYVAMSALQKASGADARTSR